jgi:REP element-mobilizing transposase RayT
MTRTMRVEYSGAIYHVMDRGDRREDIFVDDVDRQDFLKTLAEAGQKTGWPIPAYCLMRNHLHLVLETPNANLVAGMRWFLSAYTIRFGENHSEELHRETAEQRANRIIVEELSRRGWEESDLATRPG